LASQDDVFFLGVKTFAGGALARRNANLTLWTTTGHRGFGFQSWQLFRE